VGSGRTAVVVGTLALAFFGACTSGNYDGTNYVADGGSRTKIADVPAGAAAIIVTDDKFFALEIASDSFAGAAHIEIKQLADRTIDNNITVPVYEVTSSVPIASGKRVVVVLSSGDSFNADLQQQRRLVVARLNGSTATALPGGVAPSNREYFGLASTLGQFSLVLGVETSVPTRDGPLPTSCFYSKCCKLEAIANRSCVDGVPFCPRGSGGGPSGGDNANRGLAGTTRFDCYLGCTDLDLDVTTCGIVSDGGTPKQPLQCGSAGVCNSPAVCCVEATTPRLTCRQGGCAGLTVSCLGDAQCSPGQVCCNLGTEVKCSAACPGQRICNDNSQCSGDNPGPCNAIPGTCSFVKKCATTPVPAACQ
jgi:hypothetical protein